MMTVGVPLAVALLGLLMYALGLPSHPKTAEIGKIMFFVGALVFVANFAGFAHGTHLNLTS